MPNFSYTLQKSVIYTPLYLAWLNAREGTNLSRRVTKISGTGLPEACGWLSKVLTEVKMAQGHLAKY